MHHELHVTIRYPDVDGDWQAITVKTEEAAEEDYFLVQQEDDIVFQGSTTHPGYTFDSARVEHQLGHYIGWNCLGEAIFLNINEANEMHGCFWKDRKECAEFSALADEGFPPGPGEAARAVCVEWELRHVITTDRDLVNACSGRSASPTRPRRIAQPGDAQFTAKELPNGRWGVTKHPGEHIATLKTEALARAVLALLRQPSTLAINIEGGLVEDVVIPPGLDPYLDVLVVDWDIETDNVDEVVNGVTVTTENGDQRLVSVRNPHLVFPTGAADADRAVERYYRR